MSLTFSKNGLLVASLAVSTTGAFAQHRLHEFQSPFYANGVFPGYANNGAYGEAHLILGDINLDGYDDIVITAPWAFVSGDQSGAAYAYSGRDGTELWSISGAPGDRLGSVASAAGQIDGDGIPDFFISDNQAVGDYAIRSGADGSVLFTGSLSSGFVLSFGTLGNLDGDAVDDYYVGYSNPSGQLVYIVSGANHSVLRTVSPPPMLETGRSVDGLGDIDGDGIDDYAIAYDCRDFSIPCEGGMDVFSGATGALLFGERSGASFVSPVSVVASAGDFDGDGIGDVYWKFHGFNAYFNITLLLRQEVYSGATGSLLGSLGSTYAIRDFQTLGDLNGDSRDEWIGRVRDSIVVRDPANDAELLRQSQPNFEFGFFANSVSTGGDVNGDRAPDFIFDTRFQNRYLNRAGHIYVHSGRASASSEPFCFGEGGLTPGCTPCPCGNDSPADSQAGCLNSSGRPARLIAIGDLSVTEDRLRMEVRDAPPVSFALLMSGANALPLAGPCLPGSGIIGSLTDGLRCIGGNLIRYGVRSVNAEGTVGVTNNAWGSIDGMPSDLLLQSGLSAGQTRYFQAFYRDELQAGCGTGVNTTNAIRVEPLP